MISPWTDLALAGESMVTRAKADPLFKRIADELPQHVRALKTASALYGLEQAAEIARLVLGVADGKAAVCDAISRRK